MLELQRAELAQYYWANTMEKLLDALLGALKVSYLASWTVERSLADMLGLRGKE